jgi:hypothetical protein
MKKIIFSTLLFCNSCALAIGEDDRLIAIFINNYSAVVDATPTSHKKDGQIKTLTEMCFYARTDRALLINAIKEVYSITRTTEKNKII